MAQLAWSGTLLFRTGLWKWAEEGRARVVRLFKGGESVCHVMQPHSRMRRLLQQTLRTAEI